MQLSRLLMSTSILWASAMSIFAQTSDPSAAIALTSPDGTAFFPENGQIRLIATVEGLDDEPINWSMEPQNVGSITQIEGNNGEYSFEPVAGFSGSVTLTATCGDMSASQAITIIDENSHYLGGAVSATSTAPENSRFDRLFDGVNGRDDFGANYSFAGDGQTEEADHNITLELRRPINANAIRLHWGGAPKSYSVMVSEDGENFVPVVTDYKGSGANAWDKHGFADRTVKYLRIVTVGYQVMNWGLSLTEIKLYGDDKAFVPADIRVSSKLNDYNDPKIYGSVLTVGEAASITATVYNIDGIELKNAEIALATTASEDEWKDGIYTPAATGFADFTYTSGDINVTKRFLVVDDAKYIDGTNLTVVGSTGSSSTYSSLFDGGSSLTENGAVYVFADNINGDNEHSLTVQFNKIYTLEYLSLNWDCLPKSYTVYTSLDGETYAPLFSSAAEGDVRIYHRFALEKAAPAKYLKVVTDGYNNGYGLKLNDLKLYGTPETSYATSIVIKSSNGTALAKGESTTLTASVLDQFGAPMEGMEVDWSHSTISGSWNPETGVFTAGDNVAGGEGVIFTATLTVEDAEGNDKELSADIQLRGFNIDHYLFDASLHEDYRDSGIDLRAEAIKSVVTSNNDPNGRPNAVGLFDGGKEITAVGGAGYRLLKNPSAKDEKGEIIVKLFDPVTIEAIILRWERACPSDYTVEISNHGQIWEEVAHYTDINPDNAEFFNHRMCMRYVKPITYIRIRTNGNNTQWGVNLMDFKVYGTYADVKPKDLTLNPYVTVRYTSGEGENEKTIVHEHPNTVAFYNDKQSDTQFSEEPVYLNPVFKTENGADLQVRERQISYTVTGAEADADFTLNAENHTVTFHKAGKYKVEATYTEGDNEPIKTTADLTAVHHNYMLTRDYLEVDVKLVESTGQDIEHTESANRAKELLMSADHDGGVNGTVNLLNGGHIFDVVVDFGRIIDIPAIEVLWEGACPESYSVSVAREADFSDAATYHHHDPMRRAVIDRPRFDRFAVETETPYSKPSQIMPRADEGGSTAKEPMDGSTTAIRYAKIHNVVLDPWMGNVWGAKLAEVTPYYDPDTTPSIPTGIEDVDADNNAEAPVEYFNLQGQLVISPAAGQIVIRRQCYDVSKIIMK